MAIVIDTGALIKAPALSAVSPRFYTVQRVLNEVRDKHSRQALAVRLEEIVVLEPTEEDLRYVGEFARKTGDLGVLSATDLQVIALACRLERERNGGLALRTEPVTVPAHEEKPANLPDSAMESVPSEVVLPVDRDQEEEKQGEDVEMDTVLPTASAEPEPAVIPDSEDPEDDEEGWITPENYKKTPTPMDLSDPTTSVISTDFAIQNVVLQMGLRLISLQGRRIRHLKRWIKRCSCCFKITKDTQKEFCYYCGNNTLYRVSCEVDEQGEVHYRDQPPKRVNLRGTKYPIPNPKSGRDAHNLILREDELLYMGGRQYSWNKSVQGTPLDHDSVEVFGIVGKQQVNGHFGATRRNPNEPVKSKRKKR